MKRKTLCSILAAFALTLSLAGLAAAQEITGSIVGSVKDANGAAVAGATVIVTDPSKDNLVVRTVTSNEDGGFSVPGIPSSVYTVTVEAANFKKAVSTNIKVDVGARRSVDVRVEAGRIDETVTVTADALAVELTTPTAGTTISGDQVREISINNRNWIQLLTLAPGVSSNLSDQVYVGNFNPEGQANTVNISVNGARSSQNTFTVDGADVTDRGSNLTIQTFPSVDSIGEFKVLRSLYPAESGRSGGGQVNVVTRSGTSKFHGSFFEFVRNEKFNANSYFNNQNASLRDASGKAQRPPFRYNNYGFTIGGPVYFLKFGEKDPGESYFGKWPKTYFFFSEEQRKDRRSILLGGPAVVPSAGMRNGVFSFPICLSGTISGTTRTCNQILPAGTPIASVVPISSVAASYVANIYSKIALPNVDPYRLRLNVPYQADFRQEILKIDTSLTDSLTAYYRYQQDKIPTSEVNSIFGSGSGIPGVSLADVNSPGRTHTLQSTYIVSPKLIVEGRINYSYGAILLRNAGLIARSNSPVNVPLPYATSDPRVPNMAISGLNTLTAFGDYDNFSDKVDLGANLTYIFGNHTVKFGASHSKYRKYENQLGGTPQGAFSGFNNSTLASPTQGTICINPTTNVPTTCTGNQNIEQSFANFLMGNNVSFTQTKLDITADFRQRNFEAYVQDEFRATRNLTLYLGVRYSFFGSPWDRNGRLANFDPLAFNIAQAPTVRGNGTRVTGTGNFCNGIVVNAQNYTTGPASYNCTPTISPDGQYIVKAPKFNFAPRIGLAWDPFGKGTTVARMGYGIYHEQTLIGFFEQNLGANPPYQETITVNNTRLDQPIPVGSNPAVVASENSPNLIRGVDRDFKTPYMQHWSLDIQHSLDKKTLLSVGYYGSKGTNLIGVADINNLRPGYALTQQCATGTSTTPTVACQAVNATTQLPVVFTSSAGSLILDQIRPYRGWRNISMIQPRYNSNYHSLQISAIRRFTGASQVQLAYTWSKNLTDNQTDRSTAPQNAYDIGQEYGRAALDRRHITTVNYIYELPWYTSQKGIVGKLLGGWQVSGIVTHQTGLPFTATYGSFDPAGIGFLGASPAGGRAYVLSNPNVGGAQTQQQWFNTAAFLGLPAPTSFPAYPGTSSRGLIEGPPTFRVDFTLTKNIRFTESMRLQLRGEAFNVLNRTNFTTLGLAASTPTSFGTVTGTRDPRVIQLGIKFYY
ncbi:MAG: carboxypeptidase regulatory-like domain-containing protein [Acidobacteria bacterium]|nr:carboxypeptidase regulatory-like domain-containing protein [Acidobacteriota bacterium]